MPNGRPARLKDPIHSIPLWRHLLVVPKVYQRTHALGMGHPKIGRWWLHGMESGNPLEKCSPVLPLHGYSSAVSCGMLNCHHQYESSTISLSCHKRQAKFEQSYEVNNEPEKTRPTQGRMVTWWVTKGFFPVLAAG